MGYSKGIRVTTTAFSSVATCCPPGLPPAQAINRQHPLDNRRPCPAPDFRHVSNRTACKNGYHPRVPSPVARALASTSKQGQGDANVLPLVREWRCILRRLRQRPLVVTVLDPSASPDVIATARVKCTGKYITYHGQKRSQPLRLLREGPSHADLAVRSARRMTQADNIPSCEGRRTR